MESSLHLYNLEHEHEKKSIDKNQYSYQDKHESKNIQNISVHEYILSK
jgi:hypothetical protein